MADRDKITRLLRQEIDVRAKTDKMSQLVDPRGLDQMLDEIEKMIDERVQAALKGSVTGPPTQQFTLD